jgi:hypothetical protein
MVVAQIGGEAIALADRRLADQARHFNNEHHAKWQQEAKAKDSRAPLPILAICFPCRCQRTYSFRNFKIFLPLRVSILTK